RCQPRARVSRLRRAAEALRRGGVRTCLAIVVAREAGDTAGRTVRREVCPTDGATAVLPRRGDRGRKYRGTRFAPWRSAIPHSPFRHAQPRKPNGRNGKPPCRWGWARPPPGGRIRCNRPRRGPPGNDTRGGHTVVVVQSCSLRTPGKGGLWLCGREARRHEVDDACTMRGRGSTRGRRTVNSMHVFFASASARSVSALPGTADHDPGRDAVLTPN